MKIKHKVQRKLDPTFQAELKLCSLCGPTTWWQQVVCAWSGNGPWRWLSGAHLPGRCTCGVRGGVGFSASASSGWRCAPPRDPVQMGGMRVGSLGPLALGLSILPPGLQVPPQKIPQVPGSPLLLWESCVHSTGVRASFGFLFLSQTVVPKIANMRNHREVDTNANTRGLIYKIELVSKYTRHSRAGTWTPRWVFA